MKRIIMLAASLALAAPLYAQNVATVNGKAITQESVDQFVKLLISQGQGAADTPQLREQVKEELINRQVMVQAAEKAGLAKDPTVAIQLELSRQGILVQALMADYVKNNLVTEATAKVEYEKLKKAESGKFEYNVRHILVDDEKVANNMQAKLKAKSAKFEDLAKKQSKDPGSAAKGGDLDWANPASYVNEFTEALLKLEKGKTTETPVKSQFGWHVIRLVDVRQAELPKLEEVKPQVAQQLQQQKLVKFQEDLRAKAKVE